MSMEFRGCFPRETKVKSLRLWQTDPEDGIIEALTHKELDYDGHSTTH